MIPTKVNEKFCKNEDEIFGGDGDGEGFSISTHTLFNRHLYL